MTTICECGAELSPGDWPWCPHGRSTLSVVPDDVPGGFMAENGFATPTRFDSRSSHRRALAAAGYEICAKWAGERDQHLGRFDTVDLAAAAALVGRGVGTRAARRAARWPRATEPITVVTGPAIRERDLG